MTPHSMFTQLVRGEIDVDDYVADVTRRVDESRKEFGPFNQTSATRMQELAMYWKDRAESLEEQVEAAYATAQAMNEEQFRANAKVTELKEQLEAADRKWRIGMKATREFYDHEIAKLKEQLAEQPVTRGGEEGLPSTATGLPTSNPASASDVPDLPVGTNTSGVVPGLVTPGASGAEEITPEARERAKNLMALKDTYPASAPEPRADLDSVRGGPEGNDRLTGAEDSSPASDPLKDALHLLADEAMESGIEIGEAIEERRAQSPASRPSE